jgi:hypothetical protein
VPPAYDFHPEFGYFCPAPRVRRELRVAVVSIRVGIVIGAAIVTIRAGHAVQTDGVSRNAHLKSSGPDTLVAGVAGPGWNPVRVRSSKAVSPLAGIPLGRAAPPEPDIPPAPAGPASPENAEASGSPAASPQAKLFAATSNSAVSQTRKRPSAMHARRHGAAEDENARWRNRRARYWRDRHAEDRYRHGAYRNRQNRRRPDWGDRRYAEDRYWRGAYRDRGSW